MTPAIKQAEQKKIPFKIHQYHHDIKAKSFGAEAAEKLGVAPEQVFKTLVVSTENKKLAVAILPVNQQLNLKAMAKALKTKKVQMADTKKVESTTGYVLGGVSPLGQKKLLVTVIDNNSQAFETIFVSGGKRGLEIELSPTDLAKMTRGIFENIIDHNNSK
jgi:Cys-tRNA(Pro)/Cys-tRNA(Cys) deacylase